MLAQCVRYHWRASPRISLSRRSSARFVAPMRASAPRRWTAPVAESNAKSQGCARACAAVA
eukprot:14733452-Heterocapsa_arctica.AAC.1